MRRTYQPPFQLRSLASRHRHGTTLVESAFVLPVFFFMVFAMIEFGHAQMALNLLNSSCRNGARLGAVEGTTTPQVRQKVNQVLSSAFATQDVSIFVKDASIYDDPNSTPPTSALDLEEMTDIEVADAEPRQMFLVRASVPYNSIALIPMPFMNGVVLDGQSFMRHE